MADHTSSTTSYEHAREKALSEIATITVLGVPLQEVSQRKSHQAIWWCGSQTATQEVRRGTKCIWHLPTASIQAFGEVPNFTYDGCQVNWFRLTDTAVIVEETYQRVALEAAGSNRSSGSASDRPKSGVLFKAAKDGRPPDHPTILGDVLKGVIGLLQWVVDNWPEGEEPDPPAGPKGEPTDAGPA